MNFFVKKICEIKNNSFAISTKKGIIYPNAMQVGSYFWGDAKMFIDLFQPKTGEMFQ